MTQDLNGKFVNIGEYLAEEMEYLCEDNSKVYEEDGKLFASIPGFVQIDTNKRIVTIKNNQKLKHPAITPGDIIIGRVKYMRKFSISIKIYKVGKLFIINNEIYGNIHVSKVSKQYIEKLGDAFKMTDVIRAKVIKKIGREFELTTEGFNLGVIFCQCPICGTEMEKKNRILECPFCGKREKRKLSNDYEKLEEKIEF